MRKKIILIVTDVFLITLSYVAAFVLRFELDDAFNYTGFIETSLPMIIVITIPVFIKMGMYRAVWRYASIDSFITTFKAVSISTLISVVVVFFFIPFRIPRSIFIIYWFLFFAGVVCIRFSTRFLRYYFAHHGKKGRRVLIYGAGSAGQMIAKEMKHDSSLGYHPVCFVDYDSNKIGNNIHNLPIYAASANLNVLIGKYNIEEVLIAIPSTSGEKVRKIIESCKVSRVNFRTLPSILDIVDGNVSVNQIRKVEIEDLLKRAPKDLDKRRIEHFIADKSILITGAGGSIGSELSRQIVKCGPSVEMLVDNNEHGLYRIDSELNENYDDVEFHAILETVTKSTSIEDHLSRIKTDVIFHSAAYKHVSLVENNPCRAIINNILGTIKVANLSDTYKVKKFVLISTDKAVKPTSVMGATKRVCELYIQNFNEISDTDFVAVRFGNVLDSSGSVVPKFKQQIENGGPVTVTHPDVSRYFMLIHEAVQLVMQAASLGNGGEIYILDMGKLVNIENMAKDMITMMGFSHDEIKIEYSGLKAGEKLYEELLVDGTERETNYESITIASVTKVNWEEFKNDIDKLIHFAYEGNVDAVILVLKKLVPEYNPQNEIYETVLNTTKTAP